MEIKKDALLAVALEDRMDAEGVVRNVRIGWKEGKGHGMLAVKDLKKGDLLLKVPRRLFLIEAEEEGLTQKERLCLSLTAEKKKGEASRYKEWLAVLPQSYSTISSWDDDMIQELGTDLRIKQALQLKDKVRKGYEQLNDDRLTFAEYAWCSSVVDTRGFCGLHDDLILIPYADMFNHCPKGNSSYELDADEQHFTFTCDRDYRQGEEVLLKYNSTSGWDQAADYGFINDEVTASFRYPLFVPPVPCSANTDLDVIKRSLLVDTNPECYLTSVGPSPQALRMLRIRYLSHADIDSSATLDDVAEAAEEQVSLENEWNAWSFVALFCRSALETFPERGQQEDATSLPLKIRKADRTLVTSCLSLATSRMATLGKQMLLLAEEEELPEDSMQRALKLSHEVALMKRLDK